MKKQLINYLLLFLFAAGAAGLAGCVAGDRYKRSTGEYIDDKSIDTRVREALNHNPEYKFNRVNVTSFKGTVQLSGFVEADAQKTTADQITRGVPGVKDVVNNITVKNIGDRSTGEYIDDKTLTSRVRSALGNDDYKFDEVNVSAYEGTVQLSGFVNTPDQKSKAEEIAREVQGAHDVVNNITVKDKL